MANLSFYTQANMANFYVWNGYVSSYSYSHISLSNYPYSATYYGSFTYSSTGLSGGTVTGYEQSYYGELSYEVDSASVSATTLYRYLNSGNGAAVQSYVLSGNDVIKGSIYGDHIKGYAGIDTIYGYQGNDVLDGGLGADYLYGGVGDDTFYVDNVGDSVIESVGEGTDHVFSSVSFSLSNNLENLTLLGSAAINGFGNSLANTIIGNAGANRLDGGQGADTLIGGAGNDLLYGGAGTDVLYGGAGDDWLEHVDDSDDPEYDPGQDTLYGGVGNDTYVIDEEGATIVELAGEGTDLVLTQLSSFVLGENIENLYHDDEDNVDFTGTGNNLNNWIRSTGGNDTLLGLAGDDKIEGGAGNDLIDGGTGADIMLGGAGNDTYVVDNIGDKVYETTTTASTVDAGGSDTVEASISYTLGNFVENLTLTDSGNINGTGNALANTITGNAGNNVLNGGVGNDTLHGGDGNDLLQGGLGLDLLVGDAGADIFRFDSLLNATTNVDTIKDFLRLEDVIQLENSIFTKLTLTGQLSEENFRAGEGVSAQDTNDHILYDTSSGALYYDADGSGVAAAVQFATLTGQPALTHTDFYVI